MKLAASPNPEQLKQDLQIDWSALNVHELIQAIQKHFDHLIEGRLFECKIPIKDGDHLTLIVQKKPILNEYDLLQFDLINPNFEIEETFNHHVAEFELAYNKFSSHEEWDMIHRRTSTPYRGQGIASNILHLIEKFLEERAYTKELPQEIHVTGSQISILAWLKKNGFEPAYADDRSRYDRLMEGDPNLALFSAPESYGPERPMHYIFDTEEFTHEFPEIEDGPANPKVWDHENNYDTPHFYIDSSFRIRMAKTIDPDDEGNTESYPPPAPKREIGEDEKMISHLSVATYTAILQTLGAEHCNYEEGVTSIVSRILDQLKTEDTVLVAIHGASINVGKTRLTYRVAEEMVHRNIPHIIFSDETSIDPFAVKRFQQENIERNNKGVVILGACSPMPYSKTLNPEDFTKARALADKMYSQQAQKQGLNVDKVHILIGLQRPDTPLFGNPNHSAKIKCFPAADLIITNEFAIDK